MLRRFLEEKELIQDSVFLESLQTLLLFPGKAVERSNQLRNRNDKSRKETHLN